MKLKFNLTVKINTYQATFHEA